MAKHDKETRKRLEDIDRRSRARMEATPPRAVGAQRPFGGWDHPSPLESAWEGYRQRIPMVKVVAELDELNDAFEAGWNARKEAELRAAARGERSASHDTMLPPPSGGGLAASVARLKARANGCPPSEGTDAALAAVHVLEGILRGLSA